MLFLSISMWLKQPQKQTEVYGVHLPVQEVVIEKKETRQAIVVKQVEDSRVTKIRSYMKKKGYPLWTKAGAYVKYGDKYGVNPYLLAAIGIKESTGGKYCYPNKDKHNCYGLKVKYKFKSHEEAIEYLARLLGTNKKYKGKTIKQISRIYCPPTADAWYKSVSNIIYQISK